MAVHHDVGEQEITSALRSILASETFSRSQQLSRLVRYLCDSLIAGRADHISEYTIGVEALGRSADFDPTQDSAVRVEIHRLRRRLREFYETEGKQDPIRIVIPAGQYAPAITRARDEAPKDEASKDEGPKDAASQNSVPEMDTTGPPSTEIALPGETESSQPRVFKIPYLAVISAAAIILTVGSAWLLSRGSATAAPGLEANKALPGIPLSSPLAGFRIRCGSRSQWTDRLGQIWAPDDYFEGGEATEIPARTYIPGAHDARLYQTARTGSFTYRIPLSTQRPYEMRLYFIEPLFGPETDQGGEANRLFKLSINGHLVFNRFDILADADGSWTADVRVFKDIVPAPDGYVRLDFQELSSKALLNGIEFVPGRPHIMNPIRLLPQDNFYTDSAGNLWTPDNYNRGGRISLHPGPIKNTRDQELFRHERFGRFRYAIPVDHGSYSVYLYMAEEYWGPGNPGGGDVGTRVFSVFCNGVALLRSIDLLQDTGANRAVVRGFHHLTPNAQGKLMLSFEPEHDYASIYGIEVIDEAGPDTPSFEHTVSQPGI